MRSLAISWATTTSHWAWRRWSDNDGEFNIDIGNTGVFDESNTIRIGDSNQDSCFIAGIRG